MEPTGRVILVREMVGGDPRQSRLVEVQLGCREDRADFREGWCFARRKGSLDQCGRRPRRGRSHCGVHGAGYAVRECDGLRRSAEEAGVLSGVARRLQRDKRVDLKVLPPSLAKLVKETTSELRAQPERASLQEDLVTLTAMRDLVLSGTVPTLTVPEVATLLTSIVGTKVRVFRAKLMLERSNNTVPADEVRRMLDYVIDVMHRYVPVESHAAVGRELALYAARQR